VIIAEDITSRFLNVISLFNGRLPLIAIQMQAFRVGEHVTLVFTTVLDELPLGLIEEDEEAEAAPANRSYWQDKSGEVTVGMTDRLLGMVKEFDTALELKYNKFYIGLAKHGQADNFVSFGPRKNGLILRMNLPKSEEVDSKATDAGLEMLEYVARWNQYRIRLSREDIDAHGETIN